MRRSASTVTAHDAVIDAQPSMHGRELVQPLVEQLVRDAERPHPRRRTRCRSTRMSASARHCAGLLLGQARPRRRSCLAIAVGRHLVELVDDAHDGRDVGGAEAEVEPLDQLAVVDLQAQRRQEVQLAERLGHHPGDLDVVVERERVAADDVDVGLGELAVAALLRPLAAPHLLDLVAAERELEVPGVLEHVARERHGEVEVQAQSPASPSLGVQPAQDVHLLVDLALAQQRVERLGRARLDGREAVQLEDRAQPVEHGELDEALRGKQLREAGQRGRHRSTQVGVGGAFARDGGGRAVAGMHDRRVVHRQDHLAQRVLHVRHRAAGQVAAADRAGEQHVAAEQDRLVGAGQCRTPPSPGCARARAAPRSRGRRG